MFRLSIGRVILGVLAVWVVIAVIVVFVSVGSGPTTSQPTPIATTTRAAITPEMVSFPFSWVEEDIEVTVVEVVNLGTQTDVFGNTYQVIQVPVVFRNLAHERRPTYGVVGPLLALKTDRGNIYEGESITLFHISDFDPEEVKEAQDRFEIRPDEQPVELWEYEVVNAGAPISQQAITRIWKLA